LSEGKDEDDLVNEIDNFLIEDDDLWIIWIWDN